MGGRGRAAVTVEEYIERRVEGPEGQRVERYYRRGHWAPPAERSTAAQVVETAAPLLRAMAIAMAPVVGRMAVRALAPRLRAALPAPSRPRLKVLVPLALPPGRRRASDE